MGLDFLVYDFWTVGVNSMGQSETSDVTEQQPVRRPSKFFFSFFDTLVEFVFFLLVPKDELKNSSKKCMTTNPDPDLSRINTAM